MSLRVVCNLLLIFALGCGGSRPAVGVATPVEYEDARAALKAKNYQAANDLATKALESGSGNDDQKTELYFTRATARAELGQTADAIADVSSLLSLDDSPKWYKLRGELNLKAGNKDNARQDFERAKSLDPRIAIPAGS